jgi:cytochrome oxidase Cu insertion factor (SCO1/SenC/PrrC family)
MAMLQDLATEQPDLSSRLRLVSISFDPEHDTPAIMAEYAVHWRSSASTAPEWRFVTAKDRASLEPVLKAYNQSVGFDTQPGTAGPLNHILRVFLIDGSGMIRNIYSLEFLDPQLVLNDIRSLLLHERTAK